MSEAHQAPVIRLEVDQEVYIDSVREGDTIDDGTVSTEVISFDRVGDAYILEGAIVFAGYMRPPRSDESSSTSPPDDHGEVVEHVHHRMPFWLRVPAKYQPRGIVNVASRITSWRLDVVSPGWVHILADLQISGLNAQNGYHFQCGAQEEGDLFFNQRAEEVALDAPEFNIERIPSQTSSTPELVEDVSFFSPHLAFASDGSVSADEAHDAVEPSPAEEVVLTRGGHDQDAGSSFDHADVPPALSPAVQREFDAISEARGGVDTSEFERDELSLRDESHTEPVQSLPVYDRAFEGHASTDAVKSSGSLDVERAPEEVRQQPVVAEFEFEHQVTPDEVAVESTRPAGAWESFSPSRSFNEDGFHATAGFVPEAPMVTLGSRTADEQRSPDESLHPTDELVPTFDAAPGTEINPSLWSFVDFNGPEARHTLRFVVVMDEETLDSVADRSGCSKSELVRANRLALEEVRPGQSLLIPAR